MKIEQITWSNYLYDSVHTATCKDIANVEDKLGIKFPTDYLDIVKKNQGRLISNGTIKFNDQIEGIGVFYTFDDFESDKNTSYTLLFKHKYQDAPTDKIIPFTDSGGNSTFCFDYRESKTNPKIIFVDSDYEFDDEDAVFLLADSFSDFLEMIYEDE